MHDMGQIKQAGSAMVYHAENWKAILFACFFLWMFFFKHFICFVLGLASVVTSLYLCLYYNIINAWSFWYLFHSFQVSWSFINYPVGFPAAVGAPVFTQYWLLSGPYSNPSVLLCSFPSQSVLPWATCPINSNRTGPIEECEKATPTQYFFYRETLNISSSIEENGGIHVGQTLCLLLAWGITYIFIIRGVKSTGKVRKHLMYNFIYF